MTERSYVSDVLVLGTTYEITVQARNNIGYSDHSASLVILHALPPEQPVAPVTQTSGQDIVITWQAPSDNGAEITSYQVLFKKADDSFTTELTYCDGSDSSIVSALTCTVPISTFRSTPFELNLLDSVYVKVFATNVKGDSLESLEGNGATIITKPDAPINLLEDLPHRTVSTLGLKW